MNKYYNNVYYVTLNSIILSEILILREDLTFLCMYVSLLFFSHLQICTNKYSDSNYFSEEGTLFCLLDIYGGKRQD